MFLHTPIIKNLLRPNFIVCQAKPHEIYLNLAIFLVDKKKNFAKITRQG